MRPHRPASGATGRSAISRVAVLAGVLVLGCGAAPAAEASAGSGQPAGRAGPTVLVGVGGLRWSDINAATTPALWRLVGRGSVGSLSVRTVRPTTCPIDAWLTLSAGQRAVGTPSDAPSPCRLLPRIVRQRILGWHSYVRVQRAELGSYGEPGLLGDRLTSTGRCSLAVGRGAAVALATSSGRIPRYAPSLADADLSACPVTVVDAGQLPSSGAAKVAALRALDAQVAGVLSALPPAAELLVSGIADVPDVEPGLQVVIEYAAPAPAQAPAWLTSNSTRGSGLLQLTDLTATLLTRAGASYTGVDGAPVEVGEPRRMDTVATLRDRLDLAALTETVPAIAPWIGAAYLVLVLTPLALVAAVWRRRLSRHALPALPAPWRRFAVAVAVAAAATPLSGYLVTLSSWWTTSYPALSLLAAAGVVIAVVTLAALRPPIERLGREVWGPALVVAAVTFTVLTLDAAAGTPLQAGSPLVSGPVTGGRFYGFGNVTFAVYATSALLLTGASAPAVQAAFGRTAAGATAAGIGAVAVLIEGWPSLGADFGGILAMVPGFGYLALVLAGRRVRPRGAALLVGAAVCVTAAVSVLDWLRPAERRSHFGGFVQKVFEGQADDVVWAKAIAALQTLANPAGVLALLVLVVAAVAVLRPDHFPGLARSALWSAWPGLLPTLRALLVVAVLGSLFNDSGVLVAGAMLATALPLVLVAALRVPTAESAPSTAVAARR